MSYPRSNLFRNYEAQERSNKKTYPRSNLFKQFEEDKNKIKIKTSIVQVKQHQETQWGDDESEMDFSVLTDLK